ncbi:MAG: alpha/beta hydrolase [Clostridia bacterium]|nr:alpha/beta hydrolase [Clostridia bacterium]
MEWYWIVLLVLLLIAVLVLLTTYICFRMAFFVSRKKRKAEAEFDIPPGEIYEPYREIMIDWMKKMRAEPHREVTITSFDGLTLRGNYYEYEAGAPIELMFHGYRGTAERDLCGGIQRCFALKRNVLIVDQRGCGKSEGNVISFGINESRDCLCWIDFLIEQFGPDVKILLTGISMGASTVMIAAGKELPPNVVGLLADCGFTSARAIIKKVIRQMKLPADLLYPFVKLGARLYGGFNPEETSAVEAMRRCRLPIIFFHGDADDYVPCDMSRENYEACAAPKQLVVVPGAGHGLAFMLDQEAYIRTLAEFSEKNHLPVSLA